MKKDLLIPFIVFAFTIASNFCSRDLKAQTIQLIPNPDEGEISAGFVMYKNKLYTTYRFASGIDQLVMVNGNSLTLIPNPDVPIAYQTGVGRGGMSVFNNKLCFEYVSSSNVRWLAQYDGTSITLLKAFPSGSQGAQFSSSIIYNNKLYFRYYSSSGRKQLAQFDGADITIFANPDEDGNYEDAIGNQYSDSVSRFVYKNKLYFFYRTSDPTTKLVQFDGTSFSFIPNPDNGPGPDKPYFGVTNYNNKLYFPYTNVTKAIQLAQFDGTSITLIPNADTISGSFTRPVVYKNNLYAIYRNNFGNVYIQDSSFRAVDDSGKLIVKTIQLVKKSAFFQLAQFDGSSITLIPKPTPNYTYNPDLGFFERIVEYSNNLFISYLVGMGFDSQIASFDGVSTTLIPKASGGWRYTVVDTFDNKLIFFYSVPGLRSPSGYEVWGLGQYDGKTVTLIPNPDEGIGINTGWPAGKIVFNDILYFIYINAQGKQQVAYLGHTALPVTLLNFTGKLQHDDALLQWQTATEQNSSHFTIQRSKDGTDFIDIGEVKASGSSTVVKNYKYTDPAVIRLGVSKLFYRLQRVDNDGKKQFSNIAIINIGDNNGKVILYPNPANNIINLELPYQLSPNGLIVLLDFNGRKVLQQRLKDNNLRQQLNLNNQLPGNYTLEIIDDNKKIFTGKVLIQH